VIILVMGVTSVDRTTVGRLLAERLGAAVLAGDGFHPPATIAKMHAGTPLDGADRAPVAGGARRRACPAPGRRHRGRARLLRAQAAYRDRLRAAAPGLRFVHLSGSPELIAARMAARSGHYGPPALLPSQLATLEPPDAEPDVLTAAIAAAPAVLAAALVERLGRPAAG
jgi:gluconokinase